MGAPNRLLQLITLALLPGRVQGQQKHMCEGREWAANCAYSHLREFCDHDSSILAKSYPTSLCVPVAALKFFVGEGDFCGNCDPGQQEVINLVLPSLAPSPLPSNQPSSLPSAFPSAKPSGSSMPSSEPSGFPSSASSTKPSGSTLPSNEPSGSPSSIPSLKPSGSSLPSIRPSFSPTDLPFGDPSGSSLSSNSPRGVPSTSVSYEKPSGSSLPSIEPSFIPSTIPSRTPSASPSDFPSTLPSIRPSGSSLPSIDPSSVPSSFPSRKPSGSSTPSTYPSGVPSSPPSVRSVGSSLPSFDPSSLPSSTPSGTPSKSDSPSSIPSGKPSNSFPPSLDLNFVDWLNLPTDVPSPLDGDAIEEILKNRNDIIKANLTFPYPIVNIELSPEQARRVEADIRAFLNVHWPYEDTRAPIIVDVNVVQKRQAGVSITGGVRRRLQDTALLDLEVISIVTPGDGSTYDFTSIIMDILESGKYALQTSFKESGVSVIIP